MKRLAIELAFPLLLIIFAVTMRHTHVHAQTITAASPGVTSTTGLFANCPVVAVGTTQWCYTTTGIYQSLNGSTWALLGTPAPTPAGLVKTVNGKPPDSSGNVQIGASVTMPSQTAAATMN